MKHKSTSSKGKRREHPYRGKFLKKCGCMARLAFESVASVICPTLTKPNLTSTAAILSSIVHSYYF